MRRKKYLRTGIIVGISLVILVGFAGPVYAEDHDRNFAYISQGFFRILTAAFQIPRYILQKTLSEPPGLGTIDGALVGTYTAVAELLKGLLEIARGVTPYGKYALFFL